MQASHKLSDSLKPKPGIPTGHKRRGGSSMLTLEGTSRSLVGAAVTSDAPEAAGASGLGRRAGSGTREGSGALREEKRREGREGRLLACVLGSQPPPRAFRRWGNSLPLVIGLLLACGLIYFPAEKEKQQNAPGRTVWNKTGGRKQKLHQIARNR